MFIYTEITKWFLIDAYIGSAIIDMCAKCSHMEDAQKVFDALDGRNLICWNALISGYANCRKSVEALHLVAEMQCHNLEPNETTFVSVLKACAHILDMERGMLFHITILKQGIELDPFVNNSLICLYAKCDCVPCAHKLFEKQVGRSLVSWGAMISGLVGVGRYYEALTFYKKMIGEPIEPDSSTLISVCKACTSLKDLETGRLVYCDCVEKGFDSDSSIASAFLEMFTKCGNLGCSRKVFDLLIVKNIVSYSVLISGYIQHGVDIEAIQVLEQMLEECIQPNEVTYVCILKACTNLKDLAYGKSMHVNIVQESFESILTVISTLVVMYAKLGCLFDAYELFNQTVEKDVVLWSAIIAGFSDLGYAEEAIKLYEEMHQACVQPNEVTFACVLKACASLASINQGKVIHTAIIKQGFDSDIFIGNTLVDMYSKCGSLVSSRHVFDSLHERDLVSWSAIIEGYANHGQSCLAFGCFHHMRELDLIPAEATYVSILSACSNAGLLEEGQFYFISINDDSKCLETVEHYACLVDLLGRAGQLNMAASLALGMPQQADDVKVWMTLLGACARFGNIDIGLYAYCSLMKRDFKSVTAHILLSNIYAANQLWADAKRLQSLATWTQQEHPEAWC
jgi:pentatricopeptide repeat protein